MSTQEPKFITDFLPKDRQIVPVMLVEAPHALPFWSRVFIETETVAIRFLSDVEVMQLVVRDSCITTIGFTWMC